MFHNFVVALKELFIHRGISSLMLIITTLTYHNLIFKTYYIFLSIITQYLDINNSRTNTYTNRIDVTNFNVVRHEHIHSAASFFVKS